MTTDLIIWSVSFIADSAKISFSCHCAENCKLVW